MGDTGAGSSPGSPAESTSGELRLLSYNVRSLRDGPGAVAGVIAACRPDVVCVQEAPRFLRWRSRCAALARRSGLLVVCGGRTAGDTLLLASLRMRVLDARVVLLPRTRGLHRRGLALAVLESGGARLGVASVHLGLDADERSRHAAHALDHLASLRVAQLALGGDLNEVSGEPAWQVLCSRLRDADPAGAAGAPTFPARSPRVRIDAVLIGGDVQATAYELPAVPHVDVASDHRPVLAVLRVPPG